jgi:hypothetical protein
MKEQKPRRHEYNSRRDYRHALGKWRANWMSKAWRQLHLKKQDKPNG